MEIFTVGASGTNGRKLVELLRRVEASALIDTRIHPNSQLSGYAKQDNLAYLLELALQIPLIYSPSFCPTESMLKNYRSKKLTWQQYETEYLHLIQERKVERDVSSDWGQRPVLLCSEPTPENCHRRLAAEYLSEQVLDARVIHLLH